MPTLRVSQDPGGFEVEQAERFVFNAAAWAMDHQVPHPVATRITWRFTYAGEVSFRFNFELPAHPQVLTAPCPRCEGMGCHGCEGEGVITWWRPKTERLVAEVCSELVDMLTTLTHLTEGYEP